ncbi:major facilitator superfamily domain-containing protein [Cantharellus anzutake]|uniref:major facilitator superfamily domain-containing protein n=1 Tax=Cantharellus anzutake TaxID=1750568 RepID=UPI001909005B|nr:major facilitator superfamily domain-containing protein [Cantharellus anzutake]KAF8337073.1 major facilitator superfamily domain-containing protein [Cantharellus anzutake]
MFSTFGMVNTWVFQEYYSRTILSEQSAWIGSVQFSLNMMPGIISGRLFDIGYYRETNILATCLFIISAFVVGECKRYWQFMLAQGFAVGVAYHQGFLNGPTFAVAANYFHKRRPLVFGLISIGSSIGGTVLPIVTRILIPKVGFTWTIRVLGFIFLLTTGTANLFLKRRLPPTNVKGGLFNLPAFKSLHFTLYYVSCTGIHLGLFTLLTYLDIAAIEVAKVPVDTAFYLIALANACSSIGRVVSAILAGWIGPVNVLGCFMVIAAVMTYVWPYSLNLGSLIFVSIIYGIAVGAFIGLFSTPLSHPEFGGQGDMGRRTGMLFTCGSVGVLCGAPISGVIRDATGGYAAVGAYAGSTLVLSIILMISAKRVATRSLWGKF